MLEQQISYINENEVAEKTAELRYGTPSEPTGVCASCGEPIEEDAEYCSLCIENMRHALAMAIDFLKQDNYIDEEEAMEQLFYIMEMEQ